MIFIAIAGLLAALGGYQLSHLVSGMNDSAAQRSVQLLEIEEHLDDAAIGLGRQVQEWKNMLLRANNKELYGKHQTAFRDASISVQYALLNARRVMLLLGMGTVEIDSLIAEHKALLAEYMTAYTKLDPQVADSASTVDMRIIGVDRKLQQDIASVKTGISDFAKQQLYRTSSVQGNRHLLFGLLGTISLFFMALFGLIFAYHFLQSDQADNAA
ncbi:MAG TPA: hypothetical protein VK149_11900 [Sideroxyarcus sp.]|nr:hypothetical protein [Sideroxyarcus sp.]